MKVTVISIVTGALGTVTKGLVQGFEDLEIRGKWKPPNIVQISQNTKKSPGTRGDFLSLRLHCKTIKSSANDVVKNSQISIIIIIIIIIDVTKYLRRVKIRNRLYIQHDSPSFLIP